MHCWQFQKTGLNGDSTDFLGWVDFGWCHAECAQKTTAYSEIAGAPVVEKIASDAVLVTGEEIIFSKTNRKIKNKIKWEEK